MRVAVTSRQPRASRARCCSGAGSPVLSSTIAASFALLISPAEAAAAQQSLLAIPMAALAVGCCIALTVVAVTVTVYLVLGHRDHP